MSSLEKGTVFPSTEADENEKEALLLEIMGLLRIIIKQLDHIGDTEMFDDIKGVKYD